MKLQDFLKVKQVRCVDNFDDNNLTIGKDYAVKSACIIVVDDNGDEFYHALGKFEPITDLSKSNTETDTSADSVDLHPEFEALAPHVTERPYFEVGQKAYCPWLNEGKLVLLEANHITDLFAETAKGRQYFNEDGTSIEVSRPAQPDLFHATPENHELLSKLMPWLDFEAPPVELKGSDLAWALIKKGWCGFNCVCGNSGDDNVMITTIVTGINGSGQFTGIDGRFYNNAVPMLSGYPLTAEQVGL